VSEAAALEDPVAFGWAVDDDAPDKAAAGGAGPFAAALADSDQDYEPHRKGCPSCRALDPDGTGDPFGCVGLIPAPLSAAVERWLIERLPGDIESLPGFLLRKAIGDFGYSGGYGRALRAHGALEAPGPFTRHFGPFFRRFTVSSEQLLEELLGAGDVAPPHALAVLAHLGLITVDGRTLTQLDEGAAYGELVSDIPSRLARTRCAADPAPGDDPPLAAAKRYLRGLWAGFVTDAPVKVFAPNLEPA
jgi:hypothetical protein